MENWRPIPGYEGLYEVSDLGRVRGLPRTCPMRDGLTRVVPGKELALSTVTGGYVAVCLTRSGKSRTQAVHPIVLEAFRGPCPDGMEGCHENGVRSDNRLANLRWDTPTANWSDRRRHGRDVTGEHHPNAALTDAVVVAVRQRAAAGEHLRDIAAELGLSYGGLAKVVRGDTYAHLGGAPYRRRRHGNAHLTIEQADAIRTRAASGERKSDLARAFGVSDSTVGRLVHGKAWRRE